MCSCVQGGVGCTLGPQGETALSLHQGPPSGAARGPAQDGQQPGALGLAGAGLCQMGWSHAPTWGAFRGDLGVWGVTLLSLAERLDSVSWGPGVG